MVGPVPGKQVLLAGSYPFQPTVLALLWQKGSLREEQSANDLPGLGWRLEPPEEQALRGEGKICYDFLSY